ncbi:MAG TPA: hypothetical protein EYG92_10990 [Lutibacter sp.]|nr:hypothetical protein [Lutibacter sp.]
MKILTKQRIYFAFIYLVSILFWLFFWEALDGYRLMKTDYKTLWLPFLVSLAYLIGNLILNLRHWHVGKVSEEEELFNPINARLGNVFTAATAVLAIAALIYTIKDKPATEEFVDFASYTFVFGLVSMLILWIPGHKAIWKFYFRHFQTVFLTFCITLCMGAILILLVNLTEIM